MSETGGYWAAVAATYSRRRLLRAGGAGVLGAAALAGGLACNAKKPPAAGVSTNQGGSEGTPKPGGTVTYVSGNAVPNFDVRTVLSVGIYSFATSVMSRLVRFPIGSELKSDSDLTITPDLAESWEQPADLMSLTFKLNKGVKWQDLPPVNGRELNSNDIKYTFDSYKSKGAHTSYFDALDRVETPDQYTVKFILNQPFGGFSDGLAVPVQLVFAHEIVEKDGDLGSTMVGTGPFMLSKFERNVGFTAVKNPNYFRKGLPYLDGFSYPTVDDDATRRASIRSGQADYITVDFDQTDDLQRSNPNLVLLEAKEPRSGRGLMMNQTKPPYNDVRVRRAISMAIDRAAVLKSTLGGHGSLSYATPWFYWTDKEPTQDQLGPYFQYNPAEAKKLMEAAGYKDGFKDTLIYWHYEASVDSQVALVQAQLKQNLGIDLQVTFMNYPEYFTQYTSHKWTGMFWGFQIGSSNTIDDFTYQNVLSNSEANYMYMADTEIDRLAKAIRVEGDAAKKKALIKQMMEHEHDQ
ncbi:MAG TPA: ABC transporter substrate-binding protein, partial [Dehalococcoidia bacterium]|nr:ABC transporter substrate-binding protein [Dehalococcoidia bacterium]